MALVVWPTFKIRLKIVVIKPAASGVEIKVKTGSTTRGTHLRCHLVRVAL